MPASVSMRTSRNWPAWIAVTFVIFISPPERVFDSARGAVPERSKRTRVEITGRCREMQFPPTRKTASAGVTCALHWDRESLVLHCHSRPLVAPASDRAPGKIRQEIFLTAPRVPSRCRGLGRLRACRIFQVDTCNPAQTDWPDTLDKWSTPGLIPTSDSGLSAVDPERSLAGIR